MPQSRSPLWEKYFKQKYNYEAVPKKENKGDLKKDSRHWQRWLDSYHTTNSI